MRFQRENVFLVFCFVEQVVMFRGIVLQPEVLVRVEDPETHDRIEVDATGFRHDYLAEIKTFRDLFRRECFQCGVDYVELDTSMQFDKALTEYLLNRRRRF